MKVILASGSPRRKALLEQMGIQFEIWPSQKEEKIVKEIPKEVVMELAEQKARDIAEKVTEDALIIGSDTVVAYDGKILGKPRDEKDAFHMLTELQGNCHRVYTGVCLLKKQNGLLEDLTFYESTKVFLYPMTEEEIRRYIETKEPMDKAGAYAIQGKFSIYIEKIEGEYATVVGFPVARVYQELKEFCQDIFK